MKKADQYKLLKTECEEYHERADRIFSRENIWNAYLILLGKLAFAREAEIITIKQYEDLFLPLNQKQIDRTLELKKEGF